MNVKRFVKIIFLTLLVSYVTPAYSAMTISGVYSITDSSTWMDIVNKQSGVIKGQHSKFLNLTNYGTVELDFCNMIGKVQSFGCLIANQTVFTKDLIIAGGEANLTSCQLENLFISDTSAQNVRCPSQITLNGKTLINGSVIFETNQGTIYKGADVMILGDIVNGEIVDLQE
jgi:hypothetical protein